MSGVFVANRVARAPDRFVVPNFSPRNVGVVEGLVKSMNQGEMPEGKRYIINEILCVIHDGKLVEDNGQFPEPKDDSTAPLTFANAFSAYGGLLPRCVSNKMHFGVHRRSETERVRIAWAFGDQRGLIKVFEDGISFCPTPELDRNALKEFNVNIFRFTNDKLIEYLRDWSVCHTVGPLAGYMLKDAGVLRNSRLVCLGDYRSATTECVICLRQAAMESLVSCQHNCVCPTCKPILSSTEDVVCPVCLRDEVERTG